MVDAKYIALFVISVFFLGCIYYLTRFIIRIFRGDRLEGSGINRSHSQKESDNKSGVRHVSSFALTAFLFAALYWFFAVHEPDAKYNLSAQALVKEFKANEIAAHTKYKGEFITVSGQLLDSGVLYGTPWVLIKSNFWRSNVQCMLSSDRNEQVGNLKVGQDVRFKGRVLGMEDNVILERCHLAL